MSSTFAIFLFVVVQRASVPWFLQWAKVDGAYPFSANSIVVSVSFVEILLGVSIACSSRGVRAGLRETLDPRELRKWWLLGISQAASDMLELYANNYLDASTYQVLLQSKLLVTALLMAFLSGRGASQSSLEWLLLTALSLGLTTYSILSNGSGGFSAVGTTLAVLKVILSCVNAVFTERILKRSKGVPLVHQIVHMKVFWCLWSVVFMAVLEGPQVYAPSRFCHGWGLSVLLVMSTYVVKNWSGTFLLKALDSLLKNIAEAFAMLVLYLLEISPVFGQEKALELPTFCVTMMVVLLVWAYLESKKHSKERSAGKKVYLTELLGEPLDPSLSPRLQEQTRRLGKKYGLLPSSAGGRRLARGPSSCRLVPNKNAGQMDLPGTSAPPSLLAEAKPRSMSGHSLMTVKSQSTDQVAPLDLEGGEELPDPVPPIQRECSESFGLLDTIQDLLQSALAGRENGWEGSVNRALDMCKGLRPYLEAVSSKVSDDIQAIAAATHETDWAQLHRSGLTQGLYNAGMMTSHVQGQMISFFCSMLSAQRCLEIGSFTGFSTLCMAEATRGKVISIEYDPYLVSYAKKFFEKSIHGQKIEMICGDALKVLADLGTAVDDKDRFDLIFIDGNKTQYSQYFKLINDRDLLAPGGLICIDETLWKGSVYSESSNDAEDAAVKQAMRELNHAIATDPRLVSVLLPIRNGLTLVRRLDDHVAGDRDHFNGELLSLPQARAAARASGRGASQLGAALQQQVPPALGRARVALAPVTSTAGDAAKLPVNQEVDAASRQFSEDSDLPIMEPNAARLQTC